MKKRKTGVLAVTTFLSLLMTLGGIVGTVQAKGTTLSSHGNIVCQTDEGTVQLYAEDIALLQEKLDGVPDDIFDPALYSYSYNRTSYLTGGTGLDTEEPDSSEEEREPMPPESKETEGEIEQSVSPEPEESEEEPEPPVSPKLEETEGEMERPVPPESEETENGAEQPPQQGAEGTEEEPKQPLQPEEPEKPEQDPAIETESTEAAGENKSGDMAEHISEGGSV